MVIQEEVVTSVLDPRNDFLSESYRKKRPKRCNEDMSCLTFHRAVDRRKDIQICQEETVEERPVNIGTAIK